MIKAKNIIKSYGNGESRFQVLKDISLDIEDHDFVVICCSPPESSLGYLCSFSPSPTASRMVLYSLLSAK